MVHETMQEFKNILVKEFSGEISMTTAIENYIDILAYGVSKAHGLEMLSEHLGISRGLYRR